MHRKLDDYESKFNEHNDIGLISKKIKTLNTNIDQPKLNNTTSAFTQNDILELTILSKSPFPPSTKVFSTRKRRSRNLQEVYENSSSTPCSRTNINGQLRKKSDLSCVVCCAVAHGYNFDAISCESCKAFFRRNALFNMDRLKCRRDGDCEVTLETRRRCKSCRLKKCFTVGMRKEWILTEEEKVNKKRRIEENKRLRVPTTDDLISPKDSIRKTRLDLQSLLNRNNKSSSTTAQNNDIITNIVIAYDDSIQLDLTGYGWSYPLARKITALNQITNTRNTTALRLINFYKKLHDFDVLNEKDKVNLIKNNLQYIFFFHGSLKYDPIHDVYHEENTNDKPLYGVDMREAYGMDNYIRCTNIMRALHSIVQIDKRIMQVALVIFLFSKDFSTSFNSNGPTINNYEQVFQIQNKYTEQLWLFIEKTYGSIRAIYIFSTLISKCLLIQGLIRDIQHDVYEKLHPCQVPPILRSLTKPT